MDGSAGRPSSRPDLAALRIADDARTVPGRGGRILLVVALVVGVIVLGTVIVGARSRAVTVQVAVARAVAEGPAALLNASGYVTPRRRATIAAKITARVVEMRAEEGMQVHSGDLLARLDDSDAQRRLAAAQAERDVAVASVHDLDVNLANAERERARQQELERSGVASTQALDAARTAADSLRARLGVGREQVRAAEAGVAVARQDVDNCTVRAPFAGIVVSKDAQVGEMVSPISAGSGFTRTGIATVVDMESIEVEVDVNESYIARVKPGQRVEAVLDAYPDWRIPASVRTVIPTADRQKATVKVRIAFDALDPRILPDMGVKVAFLADEQSARPVATTVLVPSSAVSQHDGASFVFLVRDGKADRRAVTTGNERGGDVEIVAGVAEGDQVVAAPPESLHEGQRVRPRQ